MKKTKVLFAVSEAVPFAKTGGLADVAAALPSALRRAGVDMRVIMPKYSDIPEKYKNRMKPLCDFELRLGWRRLYCGIEKLILGNVPFYFVDNEFYYARDGIYGHYDDGERFAFFSKAVVESIRRLPELQCKILHCNDWQSALAPVFLRELYRDLPEYENVKTVLTVHNLKFQGRMQPFAMGDVLGLSGIKAAEDQLMESDSINVLKGGLCYSDILTTVSPSYAEEIKTRFYGEGLEAVFRRRSSVLHGILNGIDVRLCPPPKDKEEAKASLCKELGFSECKDLPLIAMVGRLTEQKGLDLVDYAMHRIMAMDVKMAVLGSGETRYEDMFRYYEAMYPDKLRARIGFDEALSLRMYAGSDIFLMPSLFEPCGLSQLMAMRCGSLPVVRETGGLRDSVKPYNKYTGEGTGFSFANINADEMASVLEKAVSLYKEEPERWALLRSNAMAADFGWERSAEEYKKLYAELV